MKILIYEEEKIYRDRLQDRIDDFLTEKDVKPLEQLVIKDDTQVYQIMATISQNNIYFISLENIGLNIARVIRDLDPLGYIILLSSGFPDYQAIFNKKISALTVIHKDVNFDYELTSIFQYILRRYRQVRKIVNVIEIQSKPVNLVLVKNEIAYFEVSSIPHKIWMHGNNRDIEFYGTLSVIEAMSEHFVRIHRGIIVNIANIDLIDDVNATIYLSNGDDVQYSQRCKKVLLKKYHAFQKYISRNENGKK